MISPQTKADQEAHLNRPRGLIHKCTRSDHDKHLYNIIIGSEHVILAIWAAIYGHCLFQLKKCYYICNCILLRIYRICHSH